MAEDEAKEEQVKGIKMEEVEKHSSIDDLWLVIDGKVYDVTPFMDDHPGGGEIMLSAAGKDGTQDFEDVGHSPHARELLKKYYLDEFAGGVGSGGLGLAKKSGGGGMSLMAVLLPILVVIMAYAAMNLTA
uniref:Cytochrome b5 heme-binding domain-containing protein n=1 Tax=Micromonas pusilla TaxID=38833 RepID=A0A7S0H1R2_MICPS